MTSDQTWGQLPSVEIERQIMLAERNWAFPITTPKGDNMQTPKIETPHSDAPAIRLDIPGILRQRIHKFNGAAFTAHALAENCPDAPLKRVRDFVSQQAWKGYLGRIPNTKPAQYRQVRAWSEPPANHQPATTDVNNSAARFDSTQPTIPSRSTQVPAPGRTPAVANTTPEFSSAAMVWADTTVQQLIIARDEHARRASLITELLQFIQP